MLCPVDGSSVLVMTERQGIEIDYCPTCRGVWLDRGELDKIIERAAPEGAPAAPPPVPPPADHAPGWPPPEVRSTPAGAYGSPRYGSRRAPKRKKSSFLSELFEI